MVFLIIRYGIIQGRARNSKDNIYSVLLEWDKINPAFYLTQKAMEKLKGGMNLWVLQ
jgi:hypothetical protein